VLRVAASTALRTKIGEFIAYFNRTMAKPFRWTMEKDLSPAEPK
jgi:hypothetical protein